MVGDDLNVQGDPTINDIFGFPSQTDDLTLLDSSPLDRESVAQYRFTVVASDSENLASTATVTVTITDANDEPPTITNPG